MRSDSLGAFEIALLIGGMAFITLLTRSFFVFLGARVRVPELVLRAIRYAPLAAIVGIVAPELLLTPGAAEITQPLGWVRGLYCVFLDASDVANPDFGYDRV
jgi:branched-subunit amino acid transport protein